MIWKRNSGNKKENVIQNSTVDVLYEVPLMLEREGLAKVVCEHLK